jgi:hypothetical protein
MLFVSACVITTQIVITPIASWSGRSAGSRGRRPLLSIAFGALPIRGVLHTLTTNTAFQVLDGIAAAIFGVVSVRDGRAVSRHHRGDAHPHRHRHTGPNRVRASDRKLIGEISLRLGARAKGGTGRQEQMVLVGEVDDGT